MYITAARYGDMPITGEFTSEIDGLVPGESVVLKTDRGTEMGVVLTRSREVEDKPERAVGAVLRKATGADRQKCLELKLETVPREFLLCVDKIKHFNLPMNLVHVEHLLGGEKIIFYFLADGRVDFRELVKDIAREYHTRIEMKQIGVRDEARLKGDREHCGQDLCCRRYIKNFEPVTMKMAKSQKATLDPAKISGHCGRLMCCLRYEDHIYNEFRRKLPKKGSRIVTKQGVGEVINYDILAQRVTIETDARVRINVGIDEIIGREEKKREERNPEGRKSEGRKPEGRKPEGRKPEGRNPGNRQRTNRR